MLANLTVRFGYWETKGKGTDSGRVEHTADGLINGALGGNLYIYGNGLAVDCDIANGIIQNSNNCGNYRIAPNSPLVNHGSAAAEYPQTGAVSPTDLDGNPRIRGRRLDIGCYEMPQQKGLILLVE